MIIDLRRASKDDPASAWLTRALDHRSIGALAHNMSYPSVLPEEYDALIAFDDTTASKCFRFATRRPSTFSVNQPPDWTSLSTDAVIVPGEAIIAWNTHSEGNVVIFIQKPGHAISPRSLLDSSALSVRQAFKAEVKAAEVKTVAGMRAMWLVFTGKGTGRDVDGKGDISTTQHWVAIPREKDVLVLLLTTPADRYEATLKEFEVMLKTLKVEGKQTKEQAEAQ